jgi:rubrerythrin
VIVSEARDIIFQGLKDAMMAERTGVEFYTMASNTTTDAKGKDVFKQLAAEEEQHFEYLQKTYGELLKGEEISTIVPPPDSSVLAGEDAIFSEGLRKRLDEAHFEMTALSVGLQLEQNSIKHYQMLADVTDDPKVKEFFLQLVKWEQSHAQAFVHEMSALKEDYWAQNYFSPF